MAAVEIKISAISHKWQRQLVKRWEKPTFLEFGSMIFLMPSAPLGSRWQITRHLIYENWCWGKLAFSLYKSICSRWRDIILHIIFLTMTSFCEKAIPFPFSENMEFSASFLSALELLGWWTDEMVRAVVPDIRGSHRHASFSHEPFWILKVKTYKNQSITYNIFLFSGFSSFF